jgi:hypothetical protein
VYATALLREQQCLFVATNLDHADVISGSSSISGSSTGQVARVMPGTGSLVAALQVASGVTPVSPEWCRVLHTSSPAGWCSRHMVRAARLVPLQVNVGKGGPWLLPYLKQAFNLDPSRTAVIGDRLDTDMALGKQGGLVTLLPLTGVTSLAEAMAAPPGEAPDYILSSVADLAGL